MRIVTNPHSYAQSSSGTISGTIWIEAESRGFPESQWSDLVLGVLNMWLGNMDNFITKNLEQERLLFMDGPFEIRILRKDKQLLLLSFVKNDTNEEWGTCEVSLSAFIDALLKASAVAVETCRKKDFTSRDLAYVVALSDKLSRHP